MRFELYLDAVSFCRHNNISMDKITRHEKDGKRYWVVYKVVTLKKSEKGLDA